MFSRWSKMVELAKIINDHKRSKGKLDDAEISFSEAMREFERLNEYFKGGEHDKNGQSAAMD